MKNARFLPNGDLPGYSGHEDLASVNMYLAAEREINRLFFFTKNVCRNFCHKKPAGCCNYNWYDYKIPNNRTGRMFKAMRRPVPDRQSNNMCRFFSLKTGCMLEKLKSPVCIGMLCKAVCARLKADFGVIYDSAGYINFFEGILKNPIDEAQFSEHRKKIDKMLNLIEDKISEDAASREFWME